MVIGQQSNPHRCFSVSRCWHAMASFTMLVLLLLPQWASCTPETKCIVSTPLPIQHKYYQSGDLIIGGIISQIYMLSDLTTFRRHMSEDPVGDVMYGVVNCHHIIWQSRMHTQRRREIERDLIISQ